MKKLLLILLLALTACGHRPQAQLRQADAIIEADPDSAMALLDAIDCAGFSAADSAYYALLYTQAQIKTNVYLTSDSLISRALAAYRFSSDPSLRLRTHFYAAQVAYNSGDLSKAMKNIIVAYDIAHKEDDPYWIAKCAEMIADIYVDTYNYPQVEKYRLETIINYKKAGKIRNHRFSICDLASNDINLENFNRGIELLDSIREIVAQELPLDAVLDSYAEKIMLDAIVQVKDYETLGQLLANHKRSNSHEVILSQDIYNSLVEAYKGNSDAANLYLLNAYSLSNDKQEYIRALYANYLNDINLCKYKEAVALSDTLLSLQSEIVKDILFDAVSSIPQDYYAEQAELQHQHARLIIIYIYGVQP